MAPPKQHHAKQRSGAVKAQAAAALGAAPCASSSNIQSRGDSGGAGSLAATEELAERRLWTPTFETAVSLLILPRVVSALLNPIADCDETFNYWEPLHYIMYGFGFQTWEYSPVYALRSYLYLLFHWLLAKATAFGLTLGMLGAAQQTVSKVMVFYGVRGALGLICSYAEGVFYRSCIAHFGRRTARYLLWILVWNAGMFHASTAFLPSTFVMYLVMAFMSAWMDKQHYLAILWGVIAVLCGWPYVGVLFIPLAIETLYARGVFKSLFAGAAIGISVLALELSVNFHFYKRLVLPAWKIVEYNVLSGETDSTLYGTEPWSFYVMNLALNMNVVAALAIPAALFVCLLPGHYPTSKLQLLAYLLPMYIWLAIMFSQAHKEERFLFPVYPLLCLASAIMLSAAVYRLECVFHSHTAIGRTLSTLLVWGVLGVYTLLSVSRIASNVVNYSAPLRVYHHLHEHVLPNAARSALYGQGLQRQQLSVNLCVSKEWYRFPSSFFIPTNATRVQFVKSAFSGQLPKPFMQHENGTWVVPTDMNNKNQEELSRYIPMAECDFFVDLNLPNQEETKLWEEFETWKLVHKEAFLHTEASKSPYRSFYIPLLTPKHVQYTDYAIYKRIASTNKKN